jgi:hypothetical protein
MVFENTVLMRIFEPKIRKYQEDRENCIKKRSIIFILHQLLGRSNEG